MKTPFLFLYCAAVAASAQVSVTNDNGQYISTNVGPHERVWSRVTWQTNHAGVVSAVTRRAYIEIGTGLNFLTNGEWLQSQEVIDILADGSASATQGQHQVHFPPDIYAGVIDLTMPDGRHLRSRPAGLGYSDGTNSVLIAEVTNCAGVVAGNQVLYSNCFDNVNASILYTYTISGLEQDVIVNTQIPPPEQYQLASADCQLFVITEFLDPPAPSVTTGTNWQGGIPFDEDAIDWGAMRMAQGRAFAIGAESEGALTIHTWVVQDGREFLIEQSPLGALTQSMKALPQRQASVTKPKSIRVAAGRIPAPPQRQASVKGPVA